MIRSNEFLISVSVTGVGHLVPQPFHVLNLVTTKETPPERDSALLRARLERV